MRNHDQSERAWLRDRQAVLRGLGRAQAAGDRKLVAAYESVMNLLATRAQKTAGAGDRRQARA